MDETREGTLQLLIPEATPSLNRIVGQHWSRYRKHRVRWCWLVRQARLEAKIWEPHAPMTARVKIERHVKHARQVCDEDNFDGGCKMLLDALKHEGFIVDDDKAHLMLERVQVVSGARRTVVTIAPAAAPCWNG